MEPVWEDGTQMVKYLYGMPGDTVEIDKFQNVMINDVLIAHGLYVADMVGKRKEDFIGKGTLGPDSYWFLVLAQQASIPDTGAMLILTR